MIKGGIKNIQRVNGIRRVRSMRTGLTERVQEKLEDTNFRDRTFNRVRALDQKIIARRSRFNDRFNSISNNIGTPKTI